MMKITTSVQQIQYFKKAPKGKFESWWQKVSHDASTPSARSAAKSRSVVATSCTFRKASWKLGPEIPCPRRQPPHERTPSPPWHHKAKNCLVEAIWTDRAMAVMQAPSSSFSGSIGSSSCPSEPSNLRNFCLIGHDQKMLKHFLFCLDSDTTYWTHKGFKD